jgi:predicted RNA-binding Zn-ribbon protein involved in translation (DUF1610 family)
MREARKSVIKNDNLLEGTSWDKLSPSLLRDVAQHSLDHVLDRQTHNGLCDRFNNLDRSGGQATKQEKKRLQEWIVSWFVKKWTSKKIDSKRLATHPKCKTSPCPSCGDQRIQVCVKCDDILASSFTGIADIRNFIVRINLIPATRMMEKRTTLQRWTVLQRCTIRPLVPCTNVLPAESIPPASYLGLHHIQ